MQDGDRWTLNRVPLAGGTRYTILEGEGRLHTKVAWLRDGAIVYSMLSGAGGSGLMRVSAAGGTPRALTRLDEHRGDYAHLWPLAVPARDELVFTIVGEGVDPEDGRVAVYSPASGEVRVILEPALAPRLPRSRLPALRRPRLAAGDRRRPGDAGRDGGTRAPVLRRSGDTVTGNAMSDNGTLAYTLAAPAGDAPPGRIYVVVNWFEDLKPALSPD